MRLINYLNGIEGVVAGGIAVCNVPTGRRYHALKPFVSATVGGNPSTDPTAILDYSRLLVNGVLMRDLTPTQTIAIANFNDITPAASELPIYFSEPWRATIIGEEATSWDLTGQAKCTLELKFKAAAVAPSCTVMASYDFGRNVTVDAAGKATTFLAIIKQIVRTYNASSVYDINNLPVEFPIQRVHLANSGGATTTSVEVVRDGEKVFEGTTAQNSAFLKDYGIDASQFAFSYTPDFTQQATDALTGVNFNANPASGIKDLNLKVTSSAATVITALVEQRANGYV